MLLTDITNGLFIFFPLSLSFYERKNQTMGVCLSMDKCSLVYGHTLTSAGAWRCLMELCEISHGYVVMVVKVKTTAVFLHGVRRLVIFWGLRNRV